MKAEDPEEKSKFRAQLISAFWELGGRVAYRAGRDLILPKRLLLRFGILSPGFLTPELRDMVSRIVYENTTGEPVYYVDEWLERIAKGLVRPSTVDEVKAEGRKDTGQKILDAVEKKRGQRDSEVTLLKAKISQLEEREAHAQGAGGAAHAPRQERGLRRPEGAVQRRPEGGRSTRSRSSSGSSPRWTPRSPPPTQSLAVHRQGPGIAGAQVGRDHRRQRRGSEVGRAENG